MNNFFLLFQKLFLRLLRIYIKFKIKLLHITTENIYGYYIYIFLVMYCVFGCRGNVECSASHVIAFLMVIYVMGVSLENFLLSQMAKNFLNNLVGKNFVIHYL